MYRLTASSSTKGHIRLPQFHGIIRSFLFGYIYIYIYIYVPHYSIWYPLGTMEKNGTESMALSKHAVSVEPEQGPDMEDMRNEKMNDLSREMAKNAVQPPSTTWDTGKHSSSTARVPYGPCSSPCRSSCVHTTSRFWATFTPFRHSRSDSAYITRAQAGR